MRTAAVIRQGIHTTPPFADGLAEVFASPMALVSLAICEASGQAELLDPDLGTECGCR